MTVDDGDSLGPFAAGNLADPQSSEVSVTGRVFRFDVDTSTGGNTGAVEIRIFGPPAATVTLAMRKSGLADNRKVGELLLADIGIPSILFLRHLGIDAASLFAMGDIVDMTHASLRSPS